MGQYVTVTAALIIGRARLTEYLRAPVVPASAWSPADWAGLGGPGEELSAAVAVCDDWLTGDYAGLLRDLAEDGGLSAAHDPDTGSLVLDLDTRVDARLPGLIWACAVPRGLTRFLADGEGGLVTVTTDWDDTTAHLRLAPGASDFLDPDRDAAALARARDAQFDARCAASDASDAADGDPDSATDLVALLLDRGTPGRPGTR
ncbi:hypothetical protein ABZX40_19035 [Streptomyces sp. NPDC004610]|uniref:hypothetical protein n=1 Tax=unclassified Streptomyces TaxID=2593676 RepID=UPI0033A4F263